MVEVVSDAGSGGALSDTVGDEVVERGEMEVGVAQQGGAVAREIGLRVGRDRARDAADQRYVALRILQRRRRRCRRTRTRRQARCQRR